MKILLTSNALDIIEEFENSSSSVKDGMRLEMFRAMSILKSQIQDNIRSYMNVKTGNLLNSVQFSVKESGNEIIGEVGPENVPYAQIQEEGGEIPARFIKPRIKSALKFNGKNGIGFSKGHMVGKSTIRPKYYLRDAIDLHSDYIIEKFGIFVEGILGE